MNSVEKVISFSEAVALIDNIDTVERVFRLYRQFKAPGV